MKKSRKNIFAYILMTLAFLLTSVGAEAAGKGNPIFLNYNQINNIQALTINGVSMVPLRGVGSIVGAEVDWNASTKTIRLVKDDLVNTLQLNSKLATRQEGDRKSEISLSRAPEVINGSSYVPLRYMAESMDLKVDWDSNTSSVKIYEYFLYQGKKIFFGMDEKDLISLLGNPDLQMKDESYDYLFYRGDYKDLLIIALEKGKVKSFTSSAESLKYRNFVYGSQDQDETAGLTIIRDEHEKNRIVGLGYNLYLNPIGSKESLAVNERIIYELTNSFRAYNGVAALGFSEKLSDVARDHSEEMAKNNYFSHTSLAGLEPSDRISLAGIRWQSCGENIAAGNSTALKTFEQWVNSLGHRKNMLQQVGDLGVGGAVNQKSQYKYYYGQNFALAR